MTANPGYLIRSYEEADRADAEALGMHVIDWWHAKGPDASLHLVAVETENGEIVGHLQAMDAGVPEPSRRPGQCHFSLHVAQAHWQRGIGGELYARVEAFARRRNARLLYTSYFEVPEAPAAAFLKKRGFEPLERFLPSYLDLESFAPEKFEAETRRVQEQGIRLCTYADLGDSPENRRRLYHLIQAARATQPFRELDPYIPPDFEEWEEEFAQWDRTTIFLAIAEKTDVWAGVVTGLEWYFTGVHPDWRGRGFAMALKVLCITEARRRGIVRMDTENHEDNAAMIAVNRKLGFVFTTPEVACIRRF